MTVSYSGNFVKVLFFWNGSVWKAVWLELFVWIILFYGLKFIYKYLAPVQDPTISFITTQFNEYTKEFPIEFVLSFYVNQVITRWWSQIMAVPWPDDIMSLVGANIKGSDTESKLKRHTIGRYLVLTQILALRNISSKVRKRFPTIKHIYEIGLMTKEEHENYTSEPNENIRWQLPLSWAQNIVTRSAGVDYSIIAPTSIVAITNELNKFRASLKTLFTYDWICFPLVYTQATGVGLYGYFALCLIGRQYYNPAKTDPIIPFLTILKFIFYVGWFKKAQDMMRPFGEDDDDVELNYLLDRNFNVVAGMAEFSVDQRPSLANEADMIQTNLPHTKWSAEIDERPPQCHALLRLRKDKVDELFETEPQTKDVVKESKRELLLF